MESGSFTTTITTIFSVSIYDQSSCAKNIPTGVPQGSILGPYLFMMFLNDTPKQLHMQLAIYSDNTAIDTSAEDKIIMTRPSIVLLQVEITIKLN